MPRRVEGQAIEKPRARFPEQIRVDDRLLDRSAAIGRFRAAARVSSRPHVRRPPPARLGGGRRLLARDVRRLELTCRVRRVSSGIGKRFGWSRGAISVRRRWSLIIGGLIARSSAPPARYPAPDLAMTRSSWARSSLSRRGSDGSGTSTLCSACCSASRCQSVYLVPTTTVSRGSWTDGVWRSASCWPGSILAYRHRPPFVRVLDQAVRLADHVPRARRALGSSPFPGSLFTRFPRPRPGPRPIGPSRPGGSTIREAGRCRLWLLVMAWMLLRIQSDDVRPPGVVREGSGGHARARGAGAHDPGRRHHRRPDSHRHGRRSNRHEACSGLPASGHDPARGHRRAVVVDSQFPSVLARTVRRGQRHDAREERRREPSVSVPSARSWAC